MQKKNLDATILFVDFSKTFDSIHRGKMEQIQFANGLPNKTVATIMMLNKNPKVKVRSSDGDTNYFDIVAGVLQVDILAPYLFIIWLDYVLRTSVDMMKDNGFKLAKERSRRYPAQTITDADYADNIVHSMERSAAGIEASISTQTRRNTCALIEEVTSPH